MPGHTTRQVVSRIENRLKALKGLSSTKASAFYEESAILSTHAVDSWSSVRHRCVWCTLRAKFSKFAQNARKGVCAHS